MVGLRDALASAGHVYIARIRASMSNVNGPGDFYSVSRPKSENWHIPVRQEMMALWDAVASAGPYANSLHLFRFSQSTRTAVV